MRKKNLKGKNKKLENLIEELVIEIDYNQKKYLLKADTNQEDKYNYSTSKVDFPEVRDELYAITGFLNRNGYTSAKRYQLKISPEAKKFLDEDEQSFLYDIIEIRNKINSLSYKLNSYSK